MPETQAAQSQQDIDSILKEGRKFPCPAEFSRGSHVKSLAEYQKIYDQAAADPEKFWAGIARELHWFQPWSKVLEWDLPWSKWSLHMTIEAGVRKIDLPANEPFCPGQVPLQTLAPRLEPMQFARDSRPKLFRIGGGLVVNLLVFRQALDVRAPAELRGTGKFAAFFEDGIDVLLWLSGLGLGHLISPVN